jgi:hypothetical protein
VRPGPTIEVDISPRAYEAFQIWLRQEKRRLADVGAALSPACTAANVARWSSRHQWQVRSWAWDKEQDRIQQEQEARDRSAARKRHLTISQEMQSLALRGLLELKAKAAGGGALNISFGEVERMLSEAITIERLVLGEDKKDQGRFTEFRIFIGTHYNPDEEGYGKPQQYKEWLPEPTIEGDEDDEEEGGR